MPLSRSDEHLSKDFNFDPYQFTGSKRGVQTFHRIMVKRFRRCSSILDLGCGNGDFLEVLRDSGKQALGVDAYQKAIQECKRRGLRAVKADILEFLTSRQERVAEFDGVYCCHVIEHLSPDELFALFTALYKATTSGTLVVLVTPNFADLDVSGHVFWLDLTHVRPYPAALLHKMLESVGFIEVSSKAIYGLGLTRPFIRRFLVDKIRFGNRILKPNLVISAMR